MRQVPGGRYTMRAWRANASPRRCKPHVPGRSPSPGLTQQGAENFIRGNPDLDDTIKRLQAFEAAGADVLMAPGLPDLAAVRTVCSALSKPFNFMAGIPGKSFSVAELAAAGVKRISLATSLYRAAMSGLLHAAREVKERGTLGYVDTSMATPELEPVHELIVVARAAVRVAPKVGIGAWSVGSRQSRHCVPTNHAVRLLMD